MPGHARQKFPYRGRPASECGFTLIEVLVAAALTVVVGVMAYSFISSAMTAYEAHESKSQRLNEITLFFTRLNRDLLHVVERPIRNEYGERELALQGGINSDYLLTFTRGGWPNPRELPRSSLRRVAYGLNGDTLERVAWASVDRVDQENLFKAVGLSGVDNIAIRFLQAEDVLADRDRVAREWQDSWPPLSEQENSLEAGLPAAVEVTVTLQDLGEIRRLFTLPEQKRES